MGRGIGRHVFPSFVETAMTAALTNSLEAGSRLDALIAELLAKASLSVPHNPLGSAAETAIPPGGDNASSRAAVFTPSP